MNESCGSEVGGLSWFKGFCFLAKIEFFGAFVGEYCFFGTTVLPKN